MSPTSYEAAHLNLEDQLGVRKTWKTLYSAIQMTERNENGYEERNESIRTRTGNTTKA